MPYDESLAAFRRGDNAEATRLATLDVADAEAAGDVRAQVDGLCMLARVALRAGDLAGVESRAAEAEEQARRSGDQRLQRMPLHLRAVAARMAGRWDEGRALYARSIALNDMLGEATMAAVEHRNLAYLELRAGNRERAYELFAECVARLHDIDAPALVPYLIFDRATIAAMEGNYVTARAELAAALRNWDEAGVVPDPDDAAEIANLRNELAQADPGC